MGNEIRDERRTLGTRGEGLAARYLEKRGFRIVERNVRCRFGEIDLVATDGPSVVFVEVKGRAGAGFGPPEEKVTPAKQRRLALLGRWYLQQRGWLGRPARFDVIAVTWERGAAIIRHIPHAFSAPSAW